MGGASGAPRLLAINFTSKKSKNTKKHLKIDNNMWNMQKYTKIQASVQHGLYLFTCEIHSFNSIYKLYLVINVGPYAFIIFWFFFCFFYYFFTFWRHRTQKFEIYKSRSTFLSNAVKIRRNFDGFVIVFRFFKKAA